jgi:hypothetical protein
MTAERTYELRCRSCDYQRTVPEPDLHRVLSAVAGEGHKLSVTPLTPAG